MNDYYIISSDDVCDMVCACVTPAQAQLIERIATKRMAIEPYRFPENARAASNDVAHQLAKCHEEALEADKAWLEHEDELDFIMENLDELCARENVLRMCRQDLVREAYRMVLDKGDERGDW